MRVWDNRLLRREPSLTWNVQCVRSVSRSICLPSKFLKRRIALMLSRRRSISGACTRVLISVRLLVKDLDDELDDVEHTQMNSSAQCAARTPEVKKGYICQVM